MGVIESEEAAKRLARVIVSDIEIYNKDKFHTGADLTAAIEEGRALFRSRVAPELLPLFTSVLEDRRAARRKSDGRAEAAAPPAKAAPRPVERVAAAEPIVQAAPAVVEPPAPAPVAPAPVAAAPTPAAPEPPAPAPAPVMALAETPAPAPPPAAPAARAPAARGGIIDTEEAAARLARVIISDIELYNAKKIAAGGDLSREIDEGRSLFKSRVSDELLAIFENALATKGIGKRRRAPTPAPVPVPRAKPPVIEAAEPAPAVTPAPSRSPAGAPMRPQVSAVNAPPAPQPRPGLAPVARPSGAPQLVGDAPSARHRIAAFGAATPAPVTDRASGRHVSPLPGRVAPASRTPDPIEDETDLPTPMPGAYDDVAAEPIAAAMVASPPAAPRVSAPRMPATPPPVPARASAPAMWAVGATPPSPPARQRIASVPEFSVQIESGPIPTDGPPAGRPSQAVIDALPDSGPVHAASAALSLPPPAAAPPAAAVEPAPAAAPAAAAQPAPAAAPRLSPPPPAPPPIAFAPVPSDSEEQVVSLRRGVSPIRVVLTLATLVGAGGAIWYFLLR